MTELRDYITNSVIKNTPEEVEAVQPLSRRLVEDYGYPKERIVTHPQWSVKTRPSDTQKNIL